MPGSQAFSTYLSGMMRILIPGFFFLFLSRLSAQPRTDSFLVNLLANAGPVAQKVLVAPDTYRVQIIYTQIDRDAQNRPHFRHYYFNYDPQLYFNPASMVKMPLAFLTLEKLNALRQTGINQNTTVQIDSSQPWQHPYYRDTTAASGLPTLGHFIKKVFLISDNDAYNRLYQFVGQQQIHQQLRSKGYPNAVISRQFLGLTQEQNRYTNAMRFLDAKGNQLYSQPAQYNPDSFDFSKKILLGKGYLNRYDSLVNEPFDFSWHNNISLSDFQQMLQSVMFPESVPSKQRFDLTKDDYHFLRYWMSAYPSETDDPKYDTAQYYDSYVKFFFYDSTHRMPASVRVFNKVGWAYGFLTDVSYVADFANNVEYMLSATVYVNSDGILNDDKYDVDDIGHPFMFQIGQAIYQSELKRQRKYRPNLAEFQLKYNKRDPNDKRPPVSNADN